MENDVHICGNVGKKPAISPAQCRAARALVNISRAELAQAADIGERTIADFESSARTPIRATIAALRGALEAAGIEFLAGEGIRLKAAASAVPPSGGTGSRTGPSALAGPAEPAPQPHKPLETEMGPTRPVSKPARLRGSRERATAGAVDVR
jgi:transcriptional regulator with XRE-family HTH domain